MSILGKIKKRAKSIDTTLLMPEANIDKRVYQACKILLKRKLCKIVVIGEPNEFDKTFDSPLCKIISKNDAKLKKKFIKKLVDLRKEKGMTEQLATELIESQPYFATMLLKCGYANGMVAGASWTTANVLRPALQIIKTKKGKNLVTGSALMVKPFHKPILMGDVSLIENPTSDQLCEIALSNGEFMRSVLNIEPKIAMLSYSTKGSATSEMIEKVRHATELALDSDFLIDGEMQVDSALDKQVAFKKGVTSGVAGQANVMIFPDLNVGNISSKLLARLGGYKFIGPIMLNFDKPINDLSRGCTVSEIVNTALITKLMK